MLLQIIKTTHLSVKLLKTPINGERDTTAWLADEKLKGKFSSFFFPILLHFLGELTETEKQNTYWVESVVLFEALFKNG